MNPEIENGGIVKKYFIPVCLGKYEIRVLVISVARELLLLTITSFILTTRVELDNECSGKLV